MIPVNEPKIGTKEIAYVTDCLQTGWISSGGSYLEKFEAAWAAYCGRQFGVAVSNGTVALELAVQALNLEPGDEVIMPSFTIISCAQAVIYSGGVPVLVDVDPATWCMDVNQIEAKITPHTRAIMPVHIYGHPVDMDPVMELANHYNLTVIEDAAEAHGAEFHTGWSTGSGQWQRCGSFGVMSTFSFYANKIVTTGEGGMVLTDDAKLAERLRSLRNLCFHHERRFYHYELGHNFRMTNLQAAIGLGQLERIDDTLSHKRWLGRTYTEKLKNIPGLSLPIEMPWAKPVYWMYAVLLEDSVNFDAKEFSKRLADVGVMTRPFFWGMHEQPVLNKMGLFLNERYPVTERISRRGLYLPSGQTLTEEQLNQVVSSVHAAMHVKMSNL